MQHQEVVASDQPDLEHQQHEQGDEGEDERRLDDRLAVLAPVPPPRRGHLTRPITLLITASNSRPTAPDLVAQATSSRAMPAGAEQHQGVLGGGLAAVTAVDGTAGEDPVEGDDQGGVGADEDLGHGELPFTVGCGPGRRAEGAAEGGERGRAAG